MGKAKKPRPPRCLCSSALHYALGIVSPSKLHRFHCGYCSEKDIVAVLEYIMAMHEYKSKMAARKKK